jgi:D-serine dehydratase
MDNPKLQKVYLDKIETLTRSDIEEMRIRFSPRDSENIIKTGEVISVTPIETPNNELNKYTIKVNKKITYQINMLESYIKQLKKKKKDKEQNEGLIRSSRVAVSDLKEMLKKILRVNEYAQRKPTGIFQETGIEEKRY